MDLEPGPSERADGGADAWTAFEREAASWAAKALEGDASACASLLGSPVELKRWLAEARGAADGEAGPASGGGAAQSQRRRFPEGGLPSEAAALAAQYAALEGKAGTADFKSDVQGIERAILTGSIDALRETVERAPMALWAMDFTLLEYEGDNVLSFAAKYAPAGADLAIIAYLSSLGARLPEEGLNYVLGEAMARADGLWRKSPRRVAEAFEAAGHVFCAVDGYAALSQGSVEREPGGAMASVDGQKVEWLEELEARGVDWRERLTAERCKETMDALPMSLSRPGHAADFIAHALGEGGAGLGAWLGLSRGPSRDAAFWAEMGPFLARRGLAAQALRAACLSGDRERWEMILPYAEAQEMTGLVGKAAAEPAEGRARRL